MTKPFRLRPIFAPLIKKIAQIAIKMKISPNVATWLMLIFAIIAAVGLLIWGSFIWYGVFIFITGIMDGIDGAVARLSGKTSKFGAFFDSAFDRISEGVIFGGLILYAQYYSIEYADLISIIAVFGFLFSFLISYTRARAELEVYNSNLSQNTSLVFNIGILARSERLFYLFLMAMVVQFTSVYVLIVLMIIFVLLTLITFLQRFFTYKLYLERISSSYTAKPQH